MAASYSRHYNTLDTNLQYMCTTILQKECDPRQESVFHATKDLFSTV